MHLTCQVYSINDIEESCFDSIIVLPHHTPENQVNGNNYVNNECFGVS